MSRGRLFSAVFLVGAVVAGCSAPVHNEFEYEQDRAKEKLAGVLEYSESVSAPAIAYPSEAPPGFRFVDFIALNSSLTRTQFYYDSVRIVVCASMDPKQCSDSPDGYGDQPLIATGEAHGVNWSVVAFAQPELRMTQQEPQAHSKQDEGVDNSEGYAAPEQSDSTDEIFSFWESIEFTVAEVPQWMRDYSVNPQICEPSCL